MIRFCLFSLFVACGPTHINRSEFKGDRCPDEFEDYGDFYNQGGWLDNDDDRDELKNREDRCPNDPEDFDNFEDEDGCPDLDNDEDGLRDPYDQCPSDPETDNGFEDDDGCPDTAPLNAIPVDAHGDSLIADRIEFETRTWVISPLGDLVIQKVAKLIWEHPEWRLIEVQGHTDEIGSDDYNLWLSDKRAFEVVLRLVGYLIDGKRLVPKAYGKKRSRVPGERSPANRRVEFHILRQVNQPRSLPPPGK